MARPATEFHAVVRRKRGHVHRYLIPNGEPTWRGRTEPYRLPSAVSRLFPTNALLARAMGFGREGEHRQGTRAWRRRKNVLDDAARWRRGARNPDRGPHAGRLQSAGRKEQRRLATPRTERAVLELMATYGVTVNELEGHTDYDDRDRDFRSLVFVRPSVLAYPFNRSPSFAELVAGGPPYRWGALWEAFSFAWSFAYSGDEFLFGGQFDSVDSGGISFTLGRRDDPPPAYEYALGALAA